MVISNTTERQAPPKLTLVLVLVVFVCQLLASSPALAVQYSSAEHLLDVTVSHAHNHDHHAEHVDNDVAKTDISGGQPDHDHAKHSHISCHLTEPLALSAAFYQADTVDGAVTSYQDCHHAPPIPPPTT